MQIIQFVQPRENCLKTGNPVIFQSLQTLVNGQGNVPIDLVSLSGGDSAYYGGTFTNKGCKYATLSISYLTGNDCDNCTVDPLVISQKTMVVEPNQTMVLPDGFWFRFSVTLTDKAGNPSALTGNLTQDIGLHTAYTPDCPDCATLVPAAASIFLQKIATINGTGAVGDTISYAFSVTNTGLEDLQNISIADPLVSVLGNLAVLPAGTRDTVSFTATYTITAADVAAGQVVNVATANATSVNGAPVSSQSTSIVNVRDQQAPTPIITIDPNHNGTDEVTVTIVWDENVLECGPDICNIIGGTPV